MDLDIDVSDVSNILVVAEDESVVKRIGVMEILREAINNARFGTPEGMHGIEVGYITQLWRM